MRAGDIDIDTDFSCILLDEKLYKEKHKNISIYDISYKTSTVANPLCIRYDNIDGFIKIYNKIYDSIKYLISKKRVLQIVLIIILQ